MKKSFTKKQATQVFKDHDINDEGRLDGTYLVKALRFLGLPITETDIPDLLECVGREKDKFVNLDEFLEIMTELKSNEDDVEEDAFEEDESIADKAFEMLVDPSTNAITLESLLRACREQDETWTRQQVVEMMHEADLNHDGMIDSKEFTMICRKAGL
ncbi:hypothetical protein EDC96DRAFT_252768 [Choanephora cucurbitarum]|nr:hypothetical protein EDC96DRAFT_252768 [Choanephora cucurbitarum]